MCTSVSACVVFNLSHLQLALSWQASPLPLLVLNGAQRESLQFALPFLPLLLLSALPWVCKQISAHVTSRFASQLSSALALPPLPLSSNLQAERRQNEPDTDEWDACKHAHVYVSACAHLCACMCERETRETFAAKSREVLVSSMRMADVLTTKTEPFV